MTTRATRKAIVSLNPFTGKDLLKKITSILMLCALLFLSGCSSDNSDIDFGNKAEFSLDFTWDEELETSYLRQDSYEELTYGGPFYFGSFDGLDPFTQAYSQARAQKVKSIVSVMDVTIDELVDLENEFKNMRNIFDWYALRIMSIDPEIKETMLIFLDNITGPALLNNLKLSYLKNLRDTLDENAQNAEWGLLQYSKYAGIASTYRSYTQEMEDMYTNLLFLYQLTAEDENPAYATHNADLDSLLTPVSERISERLAQINFNIASLSYEEQLLLTTDYYFSKKMVAFIDAESEKLRKSLNAYDGSKELVDDDVIAFIQGSLDDAQVLKKHVEMKLEAVSQDQLLPLELFADTKEITLFVNSAYAFNPLDMFDNALNSAVHYASNSPIVNKTVKAINRATKPMEDMVNAGINTTWNGIKAAGREAYAATKDVGQIVGYGLDSANAVVQSTIDISQEVYYSKGQSWRKTFINSLESIDRNVNEVHENFLYARSGGAILDEAEKVLDDTEDMARFVVDESAKATNTRGMISTTVGATAKMAVGFFTGLAKDTFAVLNPNKNEADTAVALTGIVLSVTGGSQSALKASQVVGKASQVAGKAAQTAGKAAQAAGKAAQKSTSFMAGFKKAISSAPEKFEKAVQIVKQDMRDIASRPGEHMKIAATNFLIDAKKGYKATRNNFTKNVSEAFQKNFKRFERTSNGVADALDDVLGSDKGPLKFAANLLDSYYGGKVDNQIKGVVGSFVKEVNLSETNNSGRSKKEKEKLGMVSDDIIKETRTKMAYLKPDKQKVETAQKPQPTDEEVMGDIDRLLEELDENMSESFEDEWESAKNQRKAEEAQRARAQKMQQEAQRRQYENEQAQKSVRTEPQRETSRENAQDSRHDWFDPETGLPKANAQTGYKKEPAPSTGDYHIDVDEDTFSYEEESSAVPYDDTFDKEYEENFGAWPDEEDEVPDESGREFFDDYGRDGGGEGGGSTFFRGVDMSGGMAEGTGD